MKRARNRKPAPHGWRGRAALVVSAVALAMNFTGCSGPASSENVEAVEPMPDLVGARLDVALSDLDALGVKEGDVEIVGGGAFGVVDEANWIVCEQRPDAGATDLANPRLIVDRTCPDATIQSAESPSEAVTGQDMGDGEDSTVEETPDGPAVFIPSARRDLRDMRKDVNDMEIALEEGGIVRVAGNQVELSFNIGQLSSLTAPEEYAPEWESALARVSSAVDELNALIDGEGTPPQVRGAFDATREAIKAALDSLEAYEGSLG